MLIAKLVLLLASGGQVQLPESLAARSWAGVGPETPVVELAESLLKKDPWLRNLRAAEPAITWGRWGDWVALEKDQEQAQPAHRAGLLLLAAGSSRWEDAWDHFARLSAAPEWAAALMPHLLPGIPVGYPVLAGGRPAPLPNGVLLRPALPPALPGDPLGSLRHRIATIQGIQVGAGVFNMRVTIEPTGVQVDLLHVSGEALTVSVLMPETLDRRIKVQYLDWMREDERHLPLRVELLPGTEEINLFARYDRGSERLPQLPKGALGRSLQRGGLWLSCATDTELANAAAPLAAAIGQIYHIPAGLVPTGQAPPVDPWTPTRCELGSGSAGRRRLLALAAAAERYALFTQR